MSMHRIERYAVEIVEGRIIAGNLQKLACERFLNDLKASETDEFNYRFDYDKADHIINFAETLVLAEGNEKKPLVLAEFQAFILGNLHGWVDKETGYRRFRSSYIQLGRQQGKSILNGIIAAYYGNFDGYQYGQLYCTATKQDQAKIVLNEIIKFIRSDEDLEELFKIKEYASTIECKITNSTIKALGRDSRSIDGFRPFVGIVDKILVA